MLKLIFLNPNVFSDFSTQLPRLDKKEKIKSKVLQLFLLIQITPKEQSHIGACKCLFYVLLMSGNTHGLCNLDFAQKCFENAEIMPFQRPKFQTFSMGYAPDPLDGRALLRVCTPRIPMFTTCPRHCIINKLQPNVSVCTYQINIGCKCFMLATYVYNAHNRLMLYI